MLACTAAVTVPSRAGADDRPLPDGASPTAAEAIGAVPATSGLGAADRIGGSGDAGPGALHRPIAGRAERRTNRRSGRRGRGCRLRDRRPVRYVFDGLLVDGPLAGKAALTALPDVADVTVDGIVQLSGTGLATTQSAPPWGLDRIDQRSLPLSGTFTYPTAGAGVTAYVLDSGLRSTHVEFSGRVLPGAFVETIGSDTSDCNGHGQRHGHDRGNDLRRGQGGVDRPDPGLRLCRGSTDSEIISASTGSSKHRLEHRQCST